MNFDLDAGMIRELLDELGRRLTDAGVAAAVYVVGGAAISLRLPHSGRRTQDIDAISSDDRVAQVAAEMAHELGLPDNWLNGAARPFVPSLPAGALDPPGTAGLKVELASLHHLLAMKLAAVRARDRTDIIAIATVLGVDADTAVQVTLDAYGADALEVFTNLADVRFEAEAAIPDP